MDHPMYATIDALQAGNSFSTGPRTEEGKRIVARNRLTHGLSGSGLLLPGAEAERARLREQKLAEELGVEGETEALFVRQLAVFSVKAEQARALQLEYREREIERAESIWDGDRKLEALETFDRLKSDPERTVQRLLKTRQGAALIHGRWVALLHLAETAGDWSEEHRNLALNLLGLASDLREASRLSLDGPTPEAGKAARIALARREVDRLQTLIEQTLIPLDEADRDRGCQGIESLENPALKLLRRYERDAQRRYEWAWSELHRYRAAKAQKLAIEQELSLTKQTQAEAAESAPKPEETPLAAEWSRFLSGNQAVHSAHPAIPAPHIARTEESRRRRNREKALRRLHEQKPARQAVSILAR